MSVTIGQAISSLRPGAEFVLYGGSVDGIVWHTPDVQPLTDAEVAAEVARLKSEELSAEEAKAAAKASAIAKLAALGLTEDEAAALVGA